MTGIGDTAARASLRPAPAACCRQELLDVADALIDTPEQRTWIRALRMRANGPRFAHLASAGSGSTDQPPAEQWCAGHNDGTAHPFNGHMTCHDCGAVNWKACYHAVADTVQNDEPSAGGSTDGAGTPADHIAIFDGPPLEGRGTP